ncbi:MAG: IclR family transcriptional regulator [Rhodococcus sp. (in: high G+C Gram-positive bacteria)]|uniref:IclR family transcriptional regulator n=1 Tax=Rhodococcus sp. TaxID=1831 RepID=UPI003BB1C5D7
MAEQMAALSTANAPSVLWKAFDVLKTFNQSQRVLSLSEIARRSGLPKSTAHRILTMLLEVKAVERRGQDYRIGLRMFVMGTCSTEVQLRDVALPHLERLRRVTRQTVHLAVLEGADVVYLEKLPSYASPATPAVIGGRLRAESTGVGKALLAFGDRTPDLGSAWDKKMASTLGRTQPLQDYLQNVRRSGIAGDREEAARGLACVATPIIIGSKAVAAISVGFSASAGSGELFVNPLRETSAAVSRALAGTSSNTYDRSTLKL